MADGSAIGWLNRPGTKPASWTPVRARNLKGGGIGWHCEKVGLECKFCYAEAINLRLGNGLPFKPSHLDRGDIEVFLDEKMLRAPLHWRDPRTIFLCSMTDAYARWVIRPWLDKIKAIQALTPQHTYIELTKRSEAMQAYNADPETPERIKVEMWQISNQRTDHIRGGGWPMDNVWLGVSVGERDSLHRLGDLKRTPAAVHHASFEPLLEDLGDLTQYLWGENPLEWAIFGGLSGKEYRQHEMSIDALRSSVTQCVAAGVAVFTKQDSGPKPGHQGRIPADLWIRQWPA